MRSGDEHP